MICAIERHPMKRIHAALVFSGMCGLALSAQTSIPTSIDVAFEVASIKPNKSGGTNSSTSGRAGSFSATNVTAGRRIIYALVLARADGRLGPQMKASTINCSPSEPGAASPCGTNTSVNETVGRLTGTGQSMQNLANVLGSFGLSRMVLDRTGLTGGFDFELRWTPDTLRGAASSAQSNDAPSIFAALQEQLGLRLESQRGPVEFLVVDSIERPTPD